LNLETIKELGTLNSKRVQKGKKGGGSPSPIGRKLRTLCSKITRKLIVINFERVERRHKGHWIAIANNSLGLEKRKFATRESPRLKAQG
jgi:hypothetical protein